MKLKKILCFILATSTLMLCSCSSGQKTSSEKETTPTVSESDSKNSEEATQTTTTTVTTTEATTTTALPDSPYLTLIGHASVKIKTSDEKVIYIDPAYTKTDGAYDEPADLILVTHSHDDHNNVSLVTPKENCTTITFKESHPTENEYKSFEVDGIKVDTVAAENSNHNILYCVGYVLTFDGISVYHAGDTSKLDLINEQLKDRTIDYALYPIDGVYNMNAKEAAAFADSIGAKNNIPIHITSYDSSYDDKMAKSFTPQNAVCVEYGSSIQLKKS